MKETALMVARGLASYGVTDIFSSPGSRNAPMVVALVREPGLRVRPVIDERSAGFIALGFAAAAQRPTALVCTSGTALLNYAPAVAEAYYRKIPLIVISADRPAMWIGQDDGQTLTQPGALANIVKASYDIKGEISDARERWQANRVVNEALQTALTGRKGPVHLNISFDEPLTSSDTEALTECAFKKIGLLLPPRKLDPEVAKSLASEASHHNVLIVGGFNPPSESLNRAVGKLARLPSVVVVADALANLNVKDTLTHPDLLLDSPLLRQKGGKPSLLITFGGSLLSKKLKEYLRETRFDEHWHVGDNDALIDSYFSLTRRIEIGGDEFFPRFANAMDYLANGRDGVIPKETSEYKSLWHEAAFLAQETRRAQTASQDWSGRAAIHTLLATLPCDWNLQLSNGLAPRYAVCGDACRFHRRDCNRGVSGIDGSVSTALGASLPFRGVTLLITGDMSMQYDLAALTSALISPKLKIVVINNGGGGIFRKIQSTRELPELQRYFACGTRLPLAELAKGYGLAYFKAESADELSGVIPSFVAESCRPALLEVKTPCRPSLGSTI